MNRSRSTYLQETGMYTFALNATLSDVSDLGREVTITNEQSNVLAVKFKEGFKVVGKKSHNIKNKTYFLLANPETGCSEIGCIKEVCFQDSDVDILKDDPCTDCGKIATLDEPLEGQEQEAHQEYETIICDCCEDCEEYEAPEDDPNYKCLGFDVCEPIRDIVIKTENLGDVMYWAQKGKPPRYIELNDIEQYKEIDVDNCEDEELPCTCLDCKKLRIFPLYKNPKVVDYTRVLGGNLKEGMYEHFFAYSDILGNEMTDYIRLTTPVSIFDKNNLVRTNDSSRTTNYGISIELKDLDSSFEYYKVVSVYKGLSTVEDGISTNYLVDINPVSTNNVLNERTNLTSNVTLNQLSLKRTNVDSWEGLTSANDTLFGTGVEKTPVPNLQPIVSLLGGAIKWQTALAKEDLYCYADSERYKGYNRDEVVPLSIKFSSCDGIDYPLFPLVSRPPQETDLTEPNNTSTESIKAVSGNCDDIDRKFHWQFCNSAMEEGLVCGEANTTTIFEKKIEYTCVEPYDINTNTGGIPSIPSNTIVLDLDAGEEFTDVETYLNENIENCNIQTLIQQQSNDSGVPATMGDTVYIKPPIVEQPSTGMPILNDICSYLDLENLTSYNLFPYTSNFCSENGGLENCIECALYEEPTYEKLSIVEVVNEQLTFNYTPTEQHAQSEVPNCSSIVQSTNQDDETLINYEIDYAFGYAYNVGYGGDNNAIAYLNPKVAVVGNTSCSLSQQLSNVTPQNINTQYILPYHIEYRGSIDPLDLVTNQAHPLPYQSLNNYKDYAFLDKVHREAIWFKTAVNERECFFIEITERKCQENSAEVDPAFLFFEDYSKLRVSVYDKCNTDFPIHSEIIETDSNGSTFIDINPAIITQLTSDEVYILVEAPIIQTQGYGLDWRTDLTDIRTILGLEIAIEAPAPMTTYAILPTCCFSVIDRTKEVDSVGVTFDEIKYKKVQRWETNCAVQIPTLKDCDPVSYKKGFLGYTESTEKYPCNDELWNSSNLNISLEDLQGCDYLSIFLDSYADSVSNGNVILSQNADFKDTPIRHFRLPDNKIAPFINNSFSTQVSESVISPLGFSLDNKVVNKFLDIAVKNEILTQEQRDNIESYEIYRGDLRLDRSVQASGLLFDMKEADRENETYKFSNYPYNAHGQDKLFENVTPYNEENYIWTFESPEYDYDKPFMFDEMSVQGYMSGFSKGYFDEVRGHAKWTILGKKAKKLAGTLAGLEVVSNIAVSLLSGADVYRVGFGGVNVPGIVFHVAAVAITAVNNIIFEYGRYRYEWLQTFTDFGPLVNFASYYSSVGLYNSFSAVDVLEEEKLRSLSVKKHITDGIISTLDNYSGENHLINHLQREHTTLLSTSNEFPIKYPNSYYSIDNNDNPFTSSQPIASEGVCQKGLSEEFVRNIASPYVSIKRHVPNQYGEIGSISWVNTGYRTCLDEDNICDIILGGDTYIARHSKKRKMPIFRANAFEVADNVPFEYDRHFNVSDAKYYINFREESQFGSGGQLFPDIDYTTQTDCDTVNGGDSFYEKEPQKFYLYYYGIPNFLTETRINTNYRYAKPEPIFHFYPQNSDFMEWTQEENVSIKEKNYFLYDKIFSSPPTSLGQTILPDYYSKELYDKIRYNPNSVMFSQIDKNQNSIVDPYKVFRPLDRGNLSTSNGRLISFKGIENEQLLAVYEDNIEVFNAIDLYTSDYSNADNAEIGGTGKIFSRPKKLPYQTDLGYLGSQTNQILSTEFGHFIVDAKRGQVFQITNGFSNIAEISRRNLRGDSSGMEYWFKKHLPFKIKKAFPEYEKLDHSIVGGVGISMGFSSLRNIVYISKKDYCPVDNTIGYNAETKTFIKTGDNRNLSLEDALEQGWLEDVSWTVSYSPQYGNWISYHSWVADYYVEHDNYFQTGQGEALWSHEATNRSYQVFYGKKHPFIVEYPTKNDKFSSKHLEAVSLFTEARRYHNEHDFASNDCITFNKMEIYNDREYSGILNLIPNIGSLDMLTDYPKTSMNGREQDILITPHHKRYSSNYFYNRVKNNKNNIPIFENDKNQILKTANPNAYSFSSKDVLEHLTGENFLIRLKYDIDTRYSLELKWSTERTEVDDIL